MLRDDPSQPLRRTGGDLHDVIPVLARSWSGGRSAPRAEGTGKAREPPADGDRNQTWRAKASANGKPETSTTDNLGST
jgi:hypothetical protein